MGPPVTRSRTAFNDSRAAAITTSIVTLSSATERLVTTLQELNDDATVHGKDAKTLRDSTLLAITEVWKDAATTSLARKISEDNSNLLHNLNDSFSVEFSLWLRRFEDIMRMSCATSASQQKGNFLTSYLDGAAREKVEALNEQECADYSAIVAHLRKFFEEPQHCYMARQSLSAR
ncbi:hypothetical protein ANCDUO_00894 [Ancylostoma duodenale]|uniref:Uncharacterized protein n=1 Tax=Ancylostoma duodenale TaxID=51022 RepID=A0A0C2DFJ6_9BILA|nr:hypothetical protein ANCDUO_00894 [Ancylostoma duodenale]